MDFIKEFEKYFKELKKARKKFTEKEIAVLCYKHGLNVASTFHWGRDD